MFGDDLFGASCGGRFGSASCGGRYGGDIFDSAIQFAPACGPDAPAPVKKAPAKARKAKSSRKDK